MKTTTLPPLRVSPEMRRQAEALLEDGETLSSMVLGAVARDIESRKLEKEFIARGLASSRKAARTGRYVSSATVLTDLRKQWVATKKKSATKRLTQSSK